MLRSLYSGVTGMKNLQTKMDVISNNIANVNTTGFKTGRVRFEDMISQTNATAQGAALNGTGGVNPQQVGLGVQVSAIDSVMTGGALQTTGRAMDFGIENGDHSFFAVSKDASANEVFYTRDGGFYTDGSNNLVTANGLRVLGYSENAPALNDGTFESDALGNTMAPLQISETITIDGQELELQQYSVDNTGLIIGTYSDGNSYVLGQIGLTNFSNPNGLEKTGGNLYQETNNSGQPLNGKAGNAGYGTIRSGFLEMSNVDLANEFTEMIVTSRAYQANSRSITTSDTMLEELLNLKR